MEQLVRDSPPFRQAQEARHPHGVKHPELHTWEHVCGRLTGPYQFMLKFRYQFLSDVALAVLQNGQRFERYVDQTLTMLEYPSFPDGKNMDEDEKMSRSLFGRDGRTGLVFVQDLVNGGLGGSNAIEAELKPRFPDLACTNIFGPYDYVIEFPVSDMLEYVMTLDVIANFIKPRRIRHMGLFCDPFPPGLH